ncbi:O-antigen ligase family protein [Nostoc sp. CHAB 5784]|uniref:O-antigen ligase family protein n=1 Tax=Nostoc mirabile TaxID=2907820 RepID=UPI001E2A9F9B|nr:O-antigen ligase family protein [Nostoc mirabile]MCC5668426.1 O-antigen ligase family protein [Nostoc mirabile CHAB5784]
MNNLITLLFCFSIILINPLGVDRGAIWSQPKILAVELIIIVNLFIISQHWKLLRFPKLWKVVAALWGLFLTIGAIATINSPESVRSLLGQSTAKDGLLYWGLIAVFTLSNALVLKLKPEIGKQQLKGLVIGGVILGLSIFPQVFNWHVDYTVTSGQLFKSHILQSTIYREQQPIGLYSHRGFVSFVLAAVAIIALVGWRSSWISTKLAVVAESVVIPALLLTQTRAGLLALLVGASYLLGRKHYKLILTGAIACILTITLLSTTRNINNHSMIDQITSDRTYLWKISTTRIKMRPFGWGFDGFEIAYPHLPDGTIKTLPMTATKAHNLFIDTALSVGIIGLTVYLGLIGFCLWCVVKSPYRDIGAVAIAYLIFTLTWYESAQYTHIFWWSLSFFGYEKVNRGDSISN